MKQIALIYPFTVPWMGEFLLGVSNYATEHGDWSILASPPSLSGTGENSLTLYNLRGWPGDGVITSIATSADVKAARQLSIPLVNFSGALHNPHFPTVALDHYAVGRVAAEHLLKCGFRRLAYYGIKKLYYSQQRRQGFQDPREKPKCLWKSSRKHMPSARARLATAGLRSGRLVENVETAN